MSKILRNVFTIVLLVAIISSVGCGGSTSNNDRGTSVLAVGYSVFDPDETECPGTLLGGATLPLFSDISSGQFAGSDALGFVVNMDLQNRLSSQFFQVTRIDCSYRVDGSSLNIPDDSYSVSAVLGPTGNTVVEDPIGTIDTTLPQLVCTPFLVVGPGIYAYLNNNQALLPQLPFRMTASCSATGISQASDILTTNSVDLFIEFVDLSECCTGDAGGIVGFQNGGGTGGDLVTTQGVAGNISVAELEEAEDDDDDDFDDAVSGDDFIIE